MPADKIDGLPAVEQALGARRLDELRAAMRESFVSLSLPKFELSPAGVPAALTALLPQSYRRIP
ncbi:MAG: hypothetical protein DMF53_13895 [Acidobacteria bacterium]|nr:MAG: hypothetical protein DMF53_13895 [Acidobacteriota bacterium]